MKRRRYSCFRKWRAEGRQQRTTHTLFIVTSFFFLAYNTEWRETGSNVVRIPLGRIHKHTHAYRDTGAEERWIYVGPKGGIRLRWGAGISGAERYKLDIDARS